MQTQHFFAAAWRSRPHIRLRNTSPEFESRRGKRFFRKSMLFCTFDIICIVCVFEKIKIKALTQKYVLKNIFAKTFSNGFGFLEFADVYSLSLSPNFYFQLYIKYRCIYKTATNSKSCQLVHYERCAISAH
jgi:hypothetical protein